MIATVTVIALLAAFVRFDQSGAGGLSSISPGDLSGPHAGFTNTKGCVTCHEPHAADADAWILAAFTDNDVDSNCLSCHQFGGPVRHAHNANFPRAEATGAGLGCTNCHTEHRGADGVIAGMSDNQCNACHENAIRRFDIGHPAFPKDFPHSSRTTIKFDHVAHFNRHFTDPKVEDRAPESCATCHQVDQALREVQPAGFESSCGACHGGQMADRELVLLRLPEFTENLIDSESILEACGPTLEQFEDLTEVLEIYQDGDEPDFDDEDEDEFESISVDEPSLFMSFLLGVAQDDPDEYGEPIQELITNLAEDGPEPLLERIAEIADEDRAAAMLAGLNPELVKRVACAWAANLEYEAPADPEFDGWYGDLTEVRYRPLGHADPVARAWIEFAADAAAAADEDTADVAVEFRDALLDRKTGVGACTKCHGITDVAATDAESDADDTELTVTWEYGRLGAQPYLKFNHAPHINVLGRDFGCKTCHVINREADFAVAFDDHNPYRHVSNFSGIVRETCAECHAPGGVRNDCLLCHEYHLEPTFKQQMMAQDEGL